MGRVNGLLNCTSSDAISLSSLHERTSFFQGSSLLVANASVPATHSRLFLTSWSTSQRTGACDLPQRQQPQLSPNPNAATARRPHCIGPPAAPCEGLGHRSIHALPDTRRGGACFHFSIGEPAISMAIFIGSHGLASGTWKWSRWTADASRAAAICAVR